MFLFGTVGPQELLIVLLIVIIIFGARKLPDLGKSLGEGIRNFKSSVSGKDKDKDKDKGKETPNDKSQPSA
ncbi:MAG: twin-arginine translocase TatA/TatE family subunit [Candidatus Aminicenantes bacterium]|nr:twin-arginine translocase TatA/TatE family subunit [Candidatus Aminicenantes bacterium]